MKPPTGLVATAIVPFLLAASPAQQRPAVKSAEEHERAAAVEISLLQSLPWSRDTLTCPGQGWSERFSPMAFSSDGSRLAVLGDGFVELRAWRAGRSNDKGALLGPAGKDQFLYLDQEILVRRSPEGDGQPVGCTPPRDNEVVGSPSGRFVLVHGSTYVPHRGDPRLVDLIARHVVDLHIRDRIVTAIAWNHDEELFALALAFDSETADAIVVLDHRGNLVLRLRPDSEAPVTALAFDLDGRSILWSGRLLHRADVRTGRALAWGEPPQKWLASID
jgi:WD40 repeat protein